MKPGDKVVCINGRPVPFGGGMAPSLDIGMVYTVREISSMWISLMEYPSSVRVYANRFRLAREEEL